MESTKCMFFLMEQLSRGLLKVSTVTGIVLILCTYSCVRRSPTITSALWNLEQTEALDEPIIGGTSNVNGNIEPKHDGMKSKKKEDISSKFKLGQLTKDVQPMSTVTLCETSTIEIFRLPGSAVSIEDECYESTEMQHQEYHEKIDKSTSNERKQIRRDRFSQTFHNKMRVRIQSQQSGSLPSVPA